MVMSAFENFTFLISFASYYLVIWCLMNTSSMLFSHCDDLYRFEVEYIEELSWVDHDWKLFDVKPQPYSADEEKRLGRTCFAAKEHVVFDVRELRLDGTVDFLWPDLAIIQVSSTEVQLSEKVTRCKTTPRIWLRSGKEENEIIIMIDKNWCGINGESSLLLYGEPYTFDIKTINLDAKLCSDDDPYYRILWIRDNRLQAGIGARAWWHICNVAKDHVGSAELEMKSTKIIRQLVEFSYHNGTDKEKRVALICPSEPVMYAYFGKSKFDVKIKILDKTNRLSRL